MRILKISAMFIITALFLISVPITVFSQVSRGMGVERTLLPDDLKGMEVKDNFIPLDEKPVGVIHAMRGHVVVVHSDRRGAYFAMAGDRVYVSDKIYTLKNSRCRVRFKNEDIVSMGTEGLFRVDDIKVVPQKKEKRSFFSLLKGKAMFYAMRLFRFRHTDYKVKTPTAVLGVRGTKFGVHVYKRGSEKEASINIMIADSRGSSPIHLAQAGGGWVTNAVCYVGQIDVDGKPVNPGEMFNGETGQVEPAPPSIMKDFEKDTQVGGEGGAKGEEKAEGGEEGAQAGTGEGNVQEESAEQNEEQTQTVQDQTGTDVEQTYYQGNTERTSDRPTVHKGYFSAMLAYTNGTDYLENVYVSSSIQDFDSDDVKADSIIWPQSDYVKATGGSSSPYDDPYINEVVTNGSSSGDLGTTHPVTWTEIGHNQYMEWGYWTQTNPITIGSYDYYFDNKGYYIFGETTACDVVSGMHGSFTYSGDAWGTYFTPDTGIDMSGTFSCNVNFNSGSISNFNMTVWQYPSTQGGYYASITGASGSFSGNGFEITGGTWELYDTDGLYYPTHKSAHGAFYGPDAQYIGGAWGMKYDSANGAVGIFKGSR